MLLQTIISYITTVVSAKGGAPFLLSSFISLFSVLMLRLSEIIGTFTMNVDNVDFGVLVLIEGGFLIFYGFFTVVNLMTGLQAAKFEHKTSGRKGGFINVDKLWKTIWKTLGMLLLTGMIMFLSIMLSYMDFKAFYWGGVWFLIVIWLLANSYEFYSIGDNLKRRHGTKPSIFAFWDKVLQSLEKKIINKIDNSSFEE